MRDNRLPKQILSARDVGKRSRGRPRRRWLDSVRNDLECRDLDFDRAITMARDRRVWREVVRGNSPD